MKITPLVGFGILAAVLLLIFAFRVWSQGGILPPHEFAYGTSLVNSEAIPKQMEQFLSLQEIDPGEIQIQAFVGNNSGKNLKPLIAYISSLKEKDFGTLVAALKEADNLPSQKQKAIQLVNLLLPYKEALRDELNQDSVIVFVYYGLKQPSELLPAARAKIANFVKQLDTADQALKFDSGKCPTNYLVGNINVYPLALDNTSWHKMVNLSSSKDAPILEIRFMGLRGIFKYLLDEMTARTGDTFAHLDGEAIESPRDIRAR
jgi:hypothetical protein